MLLGSELQTRQMKLAPGLGTTHWNRGHNIYCKMHTHMHPLPSDGALMRTPRPIPKFVTEMITQNQVFLGHHANHHAQIIQNFVTQIITQSIISGLSRKPSHTTTWTAYLNTNPMFIQLSMQLFTTLSLSLNPILILTVPTWVVYDINQMINVGEHKSLRHMIQDNLNEVKRQCSLRHIIQGRDRLDEVKTQPFSRP